MTDDESTTAYRAAPGGEKSHCSCAAEIGRGAACHWRSETAAVPAQSQAPLGLAHGQLSQRSVLHDTSTRPTATPTAHNTVHNTQHSLLAY